MSNPWLKYLPLGLAALAGLTGCLLIGPISRWDHHFWNAVLAGGALVLALLLPRLRRSEVGSRTWTCWWTVGILATVLAGGAHWNFDRTYAMGLSDYTDPTYYYLNSKYFDELQYDGLYEAMMLVDLEGDQKAIKDVTRVRSLRDYKLEPAEEALARAPEVKARFSPERWEAFSHDGRYFLAHKSKSSLISNFFLDHGYNPPPPWTLAGGMLSRNIPVEQVKVAAMVDVGLVGLMVAVVAWAYGPETGLLVLLWFFVSFSTRWPVLGHVILRYDWVAALAIGTSLLHKQKHALGGAALIWAGLVRVFPAVFWGGALIAYLADAARQRRFTRPLGMFLLGTTVFAGLIGAATLADVGVKGWRNSVANLRMHDADPEAYSSQKVGLGDAVFYRFETTRKEMAGSSCGWLERTVAGVDCVNHGDAAQGVVKGNGIAGKGVLVHAIRPWLRVVGALAGLFIVAYAWRARKAPEDLVHTGALLIWIMTTPSFYYYSLRVVLVLLHLAHIDKRCHQVGLGLLMGTEIVTNSLIPTDLERYTVTGFFSVLLGLYFMWWFAVALWEMRDESRGAPAGASGS